MANVKCLKCGKKFDDRGLLLSFCLPCKIQIIKNLTPAKFRKFSKRLAKSSPPCNCIDLKKWLKENASI